MEEKPELTSHIGELVTIRYTPSLRGHTDQDMDWQFPATVSAPSKNEKESDIVEDKVARLITLAPAMQKLKLVTDGRVNGRKGAVNSLRLY